MLTHLDSHIRARARAHTLTHTHKLTHVHKYTFLQRWPFWFTYPLIGCSMMTMSKKYFYFMIKQTFFSKLSNYSFLFLFVRFILLPFHKIAVCIRCREKQCNFDIFFKKIFKLLLRKIKHLSYSPFEGKMSKFISCVFVTVLSTMKICKKTRKQI